MIPTRGERNNNPGNIRESAHDKTQWVGERTTDDDKSFEEFNTPEDGIRALAKILLNYQLHYGLDTVDKIIHRWAPASENDTTAYINSVARNMGVTNTQVLNLKYLPTLVDLTGAIIKQENGRCIYTLADITKAVKLAG